MPYKKEAYEKARALRTEGYAITKIAELLGVAKSSVHGWVYDIPQPEEFTRDFKAKRKAKRLARVKKERKLQKTAREDARRSKRFLSGDVGRWLIATPPGYAGTTLINGYYVYEHRYLMEQKLGRLLKPNEVVHHKNSDHLNNCLENLELKIRGEHERAHNKARGRKMVELHCPECAGVFTRQHRQTHLCRSPEVGMTFCSRQCAGSFDRSDKEKARSARSKNVIRIFRQYPDD